VTVAVERAQPYIVLNGRLRGQLATLGAERVLVIGYFASGRCGVVVGDFSISWRKAAPGPGYVELNPIEGVPVYADRRLLDVLRRSNPELWPGGLFSRGTPSIRLALPEQWIAFLDGPIVMLRRGGPVTAASLSAAHRPSIELLWFEDCPNHAAARQMLIELVPIHAPGAVVRIIDATDPTVAASHRFPGSPTIRVDGVDIDPGFVDPGDYTPRCRLYQTSEGLRGLPEPAWIEAALRSAIDRRGSAPS